MGYASDSPFCAGCAKAAAPGDQAYYREGNACVPCATSWVAPVVMACVVVLVAGVMLYSGVDRQLLLRVKLLSNVVQLAGFVLLVKVAWPEAFLAVKQVLERVTVSVDVANPGGCLNI